MATTAASKQRIFGFFDDWPPIKSISCTNLAGTNWPDAQDDKEWSIDVDGNDTYSVTVVTTDGTYIAPSLLVGVGQNKYLQPGDCVKVGG